MLALTGCSGKTASKVKSDLVNEAVSEHSENTLEEPLNNESAEAQANEPESALSDEKEIVASKTESKSAETIYIKEDYAKGYNYGFLIYVPENLTGEYPIVEILNTGYATKGQTDLKALGESELEGLKEYSDKAGAVLIMPLVDRYELAYTTALDLSSVSKSDEKYSQLDLQILSMVDEAVSLLADKGIPINQNFITMGFSASGQSAHRMAVLHPERVLAVAAGGLGSQVTLPTESYNGCTLNYPIGTANLNELGINFDLEKYNKVHQFIYQGGSDTNNVVLSFDGYNEEDVGAFYNIFSNEGVEPFADIDLLWQPITKIALSYGSDISFKLYEGVEHKITEEIKTDIINFLKEAEEN